jgi:hypothetical protein
MPLYCLPSTFSNDLLIERVSTRHYKAGYDVRTEIITDGDDPSFTLRRAYTPEGYFIGTPKFARRLIVSRGIAPELAYPRDTICSIGFCEKERRWYGWRSADRLYKFDARDVAIAFVERGK